MDDFEGRDELPARQDEGFEKPAGIPPMAIVGAIGAGVLGAAVWAGIALATDYEIGWIAWGIGAAIGAAWIKFGGHGGTGPVLCAVIAVASIAGGKYFAFHTGVANEVDKILDSEMMLMQFEHAKSVGADYEAAETAEAKEIIAREWCVVEGQTPDAVSAAQLKEFEEFDLPLLLAVHRGEKGLEEYKAELREEILANVDFSEALSAFDLLWIALGVMTAWRLASAGAQPPASHRRRRTGATIAPPPEEA